MRLLKMYPTSINEKYIDAVVKELKDGGIIIYPTDTLYAIACDALNNRAVERICKIKDIDPGRSTLSIVCSDISQAADYARIDNVAFKMLKEYLPGPYTFLLPSSTTLPKVFKGRKTVGIRIPDNAIAIALATALGNPLMTTSVEVDDDAPYESVMPESIAMKYGDKVDIIIDAGEGDVVPSTVIDITDSSSPEVIREGKGEF